MASHDNDHLDAVYAAKGPQRHRRASMTPGPGPTMRRWPRPDTGTPPSRRRCSRGTCRRGAAPVLDAGAGTGLVGEWLGILGYPEVEALDISEGMLAVARAKGVYRALHVGCAGRRPAASAGPLRGARLRRGPDHRACGGRGAAGAPRRDATRRRTGADGEGDALDRQPQGRRRSRAWRRGWSRPRTPTSRCPAKPARPRAARSCWRGARPGCDRPSDRRRAACRAPPAPSRPPPQVRSARRPASRPSRPRHCAHSRSRCPCRACSRSRPR